MNNNKLISLILLSLLLIVSGSKSVAQSIHYADNAQKSGFQLHNSQRNAITLSYNVVDFSLTDVNIAGEPMKQLQHGLSIVPAKAGTPDLKMVSTALLIPQGAQVRVKVLHEVKEVYTDIDISPAAALPLENQASIPAAKGKAYQKNTFFPTERYITQVQEVRGAQIAYLSIAPFSYNPVERRLVVYKNIDLQIEILGGNDNYIEPRFRSKQWDAIIGDMILNKADLPKIDYTNSAKATKDEGCEYLIVVPDNADFVQWADSIKLFRNEQGIHTKVVSISEIGGNTVQQIKDYMQNVYNTWNPVPSAVLLMADYGTDNTTIISESYPYPSQGSNYISDNYYADCTGNDLPDIAFARMTARHAQDLEVMVHKFLDYERTPPTDDGFYSTPITALGWQTERWFQICSEVVGGYMRNTLGKTPVRINAVYDGDPATDPWSTANNTQEVLDYFGPNGQGYIPSTPSELGGWTGGTAADVVNAINQGAFILQHRDHGYESGWGEPSFTSAYITQLNNADKLAHVFSINCLTGRFDNEEDTFTEQMHRAPHGGALSMTAATHVSYSFVNDAYVWGMFDNMWTDFMPDYGGLKEERDFLPAFGNVAGKYFLQSSSWPYNAEAKQITYRLFHHHGDAFGTVYTEMPQTLTPQYEEVAIVGVNTMQIANLPEGALVGLSINGQCIGSAYADEDGIANLSYEHQNPGTFIKVVITKQNYFRYTGSVIVISPEGPYMILNDFSINDDLGNANQLADYGEDIKLHFSVKNVGSQIADNVTINISSDDEYITIVDGTEDYGSIAPDEIAEKQDAFALEIANNVPNQYLIPLSYHISDGTEDWQGEFVIKAYAPQLSCTAMQVEEIEGNGNGFVDPGETIKLIFTIENKGQSASVAGLAQLSSVSDDISFENDEFELEALTPNATTTIEAMASVDIATQLGISVPLTLTSTAGEYIVIEEFSFVSGFVMEDWETGDISQFDWQLTGDAHWTIDSTLAYEGTYSLRSGDIGNAQSTFLSINYEAAEASTITFFYKVSSENNYDELKFYIDGEQQDAWSGISNWEQQSYEVSAGTHEFKWEYMKDVSMGGGEDCAWLDNIVLPPMNLPLVDAGEDVQVCKTENQYQLQAFADNYNSLEWLTNGDGVFSATDIINPIYTFGTQDIANGTVELTLKAIGDNGSSVSKMLIVIVDTPEMPVIEGATEVCKAAIGELYTIGNDEMATYTCEITPANAAVIEVDANTAILNFASNFVGEAQISVSQTNACGSSDIATYHINVNELSTATFVKDSIYACGNAQTIIAEVQISGNEASPWEINIVGDNNYNESFSVDILPFEIELLVLEGVTNYSLQSVVDANTCEGNAIGQLSIIQSSSPYPEVNLGTYDSICRDETIVLKAPEGENYTYLWSNGAITRTLEVDYSMAVDEVATISVEVSNADGCTSVDETSIIFKNCIGIEEYEASKIVLMPNPNNGNFSLDVSAISRSIDYIAIYNSLGAKVSDVDFQNGNERIEVRKKVDLQKGMYMLRIITKDGMLMHKPFIVK